MAYVRKTACKHFCQAAGQGCRARLPDKAARQQPIISKYGRNWSKYGKSGRNWSKYGLAAFIIEIRLKLVKIRKIRSKLVKMGNIRSKLVKLWTCYKAWWNSTKIAIIVVFWIMCPQEQEEQQSKSPPRLGHLAPASEVTGEFILPFYNQQTMPHNGSHLSPLHRSGHRWPVKCRFLIILQKLNTFWENRL
jgi:hypothetical protein